MTDILLMLRATDLSSMEQEFAALPDDEEARYAYLCRNLGYFKQQEHLYGDHCLQIREAKQRALDSGDFEYAQRVDGALARCEAKQQTFSGLVAATTAARHRPVPTEACGY